MLSLLNEATQSLDEGNFITGLVFGGSSVGVLVWLFMRGIQRNTESAFSLIKQYKLDKNELKQENEQLHAIVEEQRALVFEARQEIAICNAERKLQDRKIDDMEVIILDLKQEIEDLQKRVA